MIQRPPGAKPLPDVADRLAFCVELARALDQGLQYEWWQDPHGYGPIKTDDDYREALEFLADTMDATRMALLGPGAPPPAIY